jgi:general L-amino acid transport system permease protein
VVNAVWDAGSTAQCAQRGTGACWAVVRERGRLVLFGLYPESQQWRAILGGSIILVAAVLSCLRPMQRLQRLAPLWLAAMVSFSVLMSGGWFGLPTVEATSWGGLALTFYIFSAMLMIGMPLAILVALGRHSGPQWLSRPLGMFVDLIRSIPLTAILFFMALVLPTLVASQLLGDKLMRVILGFSVFFACYQSEVIRGGLQALDKGQVEAGRSLGLGRFDILTRIVLPQVFRMVLPQTVNQIVMAFKDTSYVAIIGFFDMTASASAALGSGQWASAFVEIYLLVGVLYLIFGYSLSRYGGYLERKADVAYKR